MTDVSPNDARITARLPVSVKKTLQKAADITGETLNQFMIQSAVKEARAVIRKEQRIQLSGEEADRIFSLIENPPPPNRKLREAIEHHKAFFSEKD